MFKAKLLITQQVLHHAFLRSISKNMREAEMFGPHSFFVK
jgi:hypothetical protein